MEHQTHGHEQIHLPSPSIAPFIVGAGITLTLVGILSLSLLIIGLVTLGIGIAMWVSNRG